MCVAGYCVLYVGRYCSLLGVGCLLLFVVVLLIVSCLLSIGCCGLLVDV